MSTKIFVGRLAEDTTSDDLLGLFRKFGTVTECTVMGNYAFVHMSAESEAKAAIADLDGYSVKGSHIHVELSTATTQGRKKRMDYSDGRGSGGRYEPYPPQRRDNYADSGYRGGGGPYAERNPPREEYASEQVKDLLELYFRDPYAFDQYAKTYYYGERAERAHAVYDRRMPEAAGPAFPTRREDEVRAAYAKSAANYASSSVVDSARSAGAAVAVRDERYRSGANSYASGRV